MDSAFIWVPEKEHGQGGGMEAKDILLDENHRFPLDMRAQRLVLMSWC